MLESPWQRASMIGLIIYLDAIEFTTLSETLKINANYYWYDNTECILVKE